MRIILVSFVTAKLLASECVQHYSINVQRPLVEVLGLRCLGRCALENIWPAGQEETRRRE
jgi:hypothetical protein